MTKRLNHYTSFTPEERARYVCLDCGRNVIEIGDFCMVNQDIWERQLKLSWNDNLCITCIEARLGRRLNGLMDFSGLPTIEGQFTSETLIDRLGFSRLAKPTRKQKP